MLKTTTNWKQSRATSTILILTLWSRRSFQ
jgi:hypothetical protein